MDGLARTVFTLDGATDGVRVRAYVAAIDMDVRASAPLPESGQAASISLAEGSNLITWPGSSLTASAAVAAIVDQVTAIWRFDESQGWQSYSPAGARGVDFTIAPGDLLAVHDQRRRRLDDPRGGGGGDGRGRGRGVGTGLGTGAGGGIGRGRCVVACGPLFDVSLICCWYRMKR